MGKSLINGIRWFARILGALLVLLVLYFVIGELIIEGNLGTGKITPIDIPIIIGWISMVVGIMLAWFREAMGSVIIISGFVLKLVIELIVNQKFLPLFFVIFPIIGLLFLFCWWQSRKLTSQAPSKNVSK